MRILRSFAAVSAVVILGWGGPRARADEVKHPWPDIEYRFTQTTDPAPEQIHLAVIDLSDHHATVHVARGGADPDGDGPATTTLMGATKVAAREGFDLAVNGDYFVLVKSKLKDAEGVAAQQVFKAAAPATVLGPAMTDGKLWVKSKEARPTLVVKKDGTVTIETLKGAAKNAEQEIAGNVMLVEHGKPLYQDEPDADFVHQKNTNRQRHPRTVVGVSRDGEKLYILVVDGRSEISRGMNWKELAKTIADAGAYDALNLDGGGSSTFVLRDPATNELQILNHPSDKKERSVANVLGVKIETKNAK